MTLIKCKECGKYISKDAEVCPNCGKKNGDLFLKIVGVIFIIVAIGSVFDGNENSSSQSSDYIKKEVTQNIEYQKISTQNLERQLQENAARAQQQYRGMYVEFEGKIRNIDANGEYFNVESGGYLSSFQCYIKNEQQKQVLISKNIGNNIHVKGKITRVGEILGYSVDVMEIE